MSVSGLSHKPPSALSFETGCIIVIQYTKLAGQEALWPYLFLPWAVVRNLCNHVQLLCGYWGVNQIPMLAQQAITQEPSPQPSSVMFYGD